MIGKKTEKSLKQTYIFPMVRRTLEDYYEDMLRCYKCSYCRWVFFPDARDERFVYQCPSGDAFRFLAYYASGRMEIARGIVEGRLPWSKTVEHILYTCTTCGACEALCENINRCHPLQIIEKLREKYVTEIGPTPAYKRMMENVKKHHNLYGELDRKRFDWLPDGINPPKNAKIMYFVGCTSSYRQKEIAKATLSVLNKLGVKVGLLYNNEWCCGGPLFRGGVTAVAKESLKHNIQALERSGAEKVIFTCAGCLRAFKEGEEYGLAPPRFEVLHALQVVSPLLKDLKNQLKPIEGNVTYHDPCYLGRHLAPFPIYEEPREVLRLISSKLVEMPRNRINAFCCGGEEGVREEFAELAVETARKRLAEAKTTGAQTLATACPFCVQNLSGGSKEFEGVKVEDVMMLLDRALQ